MKIIYDRKELEDMAINFSQALNARGKQYPDGSSAYVMPPEVHHHDECTRDPCSCGGDELFDKMCEALKAIVSVDKYSGRDRP